MLIAINVYHNLPTATEFIFEKSEIKLCRVRLLFDKVMMIKHRKKYQKYKF